MGRKPYDRLDNEGDLAWDAFCHYRDTRPIGDRSGRKTAKALSRNARIVSKWSAENNWIERCRAWDRDRDLRKRETELRMIEEMHERHLRIALDIQDIAVLELRKLAIAVMEESEKRVLKPKEVRELIKMATELERLTRGEPESVTELRVKEDYDLTQLTVEQLRALRDARKAAKIESD